MTRLTVSILLLLGVLGVQTSAGQARSKGELERQLLTYLNDRLYDSCRTVVLAPAISDVHYGFAQFINGQRSDLKVTVSDERIEYMFLKPASSKTDPEQQPEDPLLDKLEELQATVERQAVEIARLRNLCGSRGLDPNRSQSPAPDSAITPASNAVVASTPNPTFTREMYDWIGRDMPREQVTEILGAPGSQISGSDFDGAVNEVYVWANPNDSFICIVFRDGKVLIKTQSGLNSTSSKPPQPVREFDYFDAWQLARRIDGRIVPLDLSFGAWLRNVYGSQSEPSPELAMNIIEEQDRVIVELPPQAREDYPDITALCLNYLPPDDENTDPNDVSVAERICIPAGTRTADEEKADPVQAWKIMATLAGLPED